MPEADEDMIWVKPVEGRTVMEPVTKLVMPAGGQFIHPLDPHWLAHMHFGDIEIGKAPAEHVADLADMRDAAEQAEKDKALKAEQDAKEADAPAQANAAAEQPPLPAAVSDH